MTEHHQRDRQRRFVEEYLLDLNATQAAVRAGYSAHTARQAGAENLSKPVIRKQIQDALLQRSIRVGITADDLVVRLWDEVYADIADLFDANGSIHPVDRWPSVWRHGLVTHLNIVDERVDAQRIGRRITSIRFADRTPLRRLLGRHLGVFE